MNPADDGIDIMRSRISRASRQPPPPRRPAPSAPPERPEERVSAELPEEDAGSTPERGRGEPRDPQPPKRRAPARTTARVLSPDEASANLAIRVRRSLDERLADVIYELRREGVRTSKVELVEMLLYELPDTVTPDLRKRLARFREVAPRGTSGPLDS